MTIKFEIGKTYITRSVCDYDCIFYFTVISRTEKFVTGQDQYGEVMRRKVKVDEKGIEWFLDGNYSMAPCFVADSFQASQAEEVIEPVAEEVPAPEPVEPQFTFERLQAQNPYFVKADFARFNKCGEISDYLEQVKDGEFETQRALVCYHMKLSIQEWNWFMQNLLSCHPVFSGRGGGTSTWNKKEWTKFWSDLTEQDREEWRAEYYHTECILVTCGWQKILVNPEGHAYARYVGVNVEPEPKLQIVA